jgi:hypothetical protein
MIIHKISTQHSYMSKELALDIKSQWNAMPEEKQHFE